MSLFLIHGWSLNQQGKLLSGNAWRKATSMRENLNHQGEIPLHSTGHSPLANKSDPDQLRIRGIFTDFKLAEFK